MQNVARLFVHFGNSKINVFYFIIIILNVIHMTLLCKIFNVARLWQD